MADNVEAVTLSPHLHTGTDRLFVVGTMPRLQGACMFALRPGLRRVVNCNAFETIAIDLSRPML